MSEKKDNKSLSVLIILISVLALVYFGYQAASETNKRDTQNPFEYNIDNFKKTDSLLITYSESKQIPINYTDYFGISINEKDEIFVAVDEKIIVLDLEGKLKKEIKLSEPAYCLESDKNGLIFAGMADHIEIINENGSVTSKWESLGSKAIITSVAVTDKFVYVADAGNLVVIQYDKQGKVVKEIGRKNESKDIQGFVIPSPYFDLDIDSEGNLWVVNPGRHQFENYNDNGDLRTTWGLASMKTEGFSGCCNPSHFVILNNDYFVTSEKGIERIKIYDFHGRLTEVVATPDDFVEGTVDLDLAIDSENSIYVLDQEKKAVRVFKKINKTENE